MIQSYLKEIIEEVVPELEWTYDFVTGEDHTGVVYYDQPTGNANTGDLPLYQPTFTIQMESSDRGNIESWAWRVHDLLDKRRGDVILVGGRSFNLVFIQALTPPGMIGIEKRKSIYTVNVQATLTRII